MDALGHISETLFIPLYARALETQRPGGIINDPISVSMFQQLDYDFTKFGWMWAAQTGIGIRTEIIDQITTAFLAAHPAAIVVNLGAGLCTRFFRLDNGRVQWYELDLPEVIQFRRRLLPAVDRHRELTVSAMDFGWMKSIPREPGDPVMVIAEGLLMYFPEEEVRDLVVHIGRAFPGAEMIVEAISPMLAKSSRIHPLLSKTRARFRWGIVSLKQAEAWAPGIRLLAEHYLFDYYPARWKFLRWFELISPLRRQMKIAHLQLSGPPGR
jgi:methyltransferase (TIGR00027 family)